MASAETKKHRYPRGERHWAEVCEWLSALGYVTTFDKGRMRGDVAERMKQAVADGLVVKIKRGVYQLTEKRHAPLHRRRLGKL